MNWGEMCVSHIGEKSKSTTLLSINDSSLIDLTTLYWQCKPKNYLRAEI